MYPSWNRAEDLRQKRECSNATTTTKEKGTIPVYSSRILQIRACFPAKGYFCRDISPRSRNKGKPCLRFRCDVDGTRAENAFSLLPFLRRIRRRPTRTGSRNRRIRDANRWLSRNWDGTENNFLPRRCHPIKGSTNPVVNRIIEASGWTDVEGITRVRVRGRMLHAYVARCAFWEALSGARDCA